LAAPLGIGLATFVASQTIAFAYPTPPASGTLSSGCSSVADGSSCKYTFQFLDSTGAGDDGVTVAFAVHTVAGCGISPTAATTSGGGFASTTLSCASNAGTGTETITATAGSVTASVVVAITAGASSGSVTLPATTPLPSPNPWLVAGIVVAAAALASGGAYLTRSRRRLA
jgi:hypothetical protein